MRIPRICFVFAVMLVLLGRSFGTETARASAEQKTIWSGVYTDDQAKNGQPIFTQFCVECHGTNLNGGAFEGAPPLKGDKFMESWREDTLQSMFTKILTTMPRRNTKVLTEGETLLLMSYIFRVNEFPAGEELNTNVLKSIQIERKDGPKPLPSYAKVQVVGCLSQDKDNWILSSAAAPTRNRNVEKLTEEDRQAAVAKPLGSQTLQLQNLLLLGDFKPEMHKGHKMLAAGILIRQANLDRLSLTEMEMVDSSCASSK